MCPNCRPVSLVFKRSGRNCGGKVWRAKLYTPSKLKGVRSNRFLVEGFAIVIAIQIEPKVSPVSR